jgi:hypothetical protein
LFPFSLLPFTADPGYLTLLSLSWIPASFTRSLIHACTAVLRPVTHFSRSPTRLLLNTAKRRYDLPASHSA